MKKLPSLGLATTFGFAIMCFAFSTSAADAPRPLAPATALSLQAVSESVSPTAL